MFSLSESELRGILQLCIEKLKEQNGVYDFSDTEVDVDKIAIDYAVQETKNIIPFDGSVPYQDEQVEELPV